VIHAVATSILVALSGATDPADATNGPRHYEDVSGDLPDEPVTAVAVDPMDPKLVYAGVDGFLFKSDDGGDSFRPVLSFPRGTAGDDTGDDSRGRGVVTDDDLATGDPLDQGTPAGRLSDLPEDVADDEALPEGDTTNFEELQQSGSLPGGVVLDGGNIVAWPRAGPGVRAIAFVPGTKGIVYVATPRGLYRSSSSGETFDRVTIPGAVRDNDVRDVVADPLRPSRLYIATAAGLYISRDGGVTLLKAFGVVGDASCLAVAAGVLDGGVNVLVGTEVGLFRASENGEEFREMLIKGEAPDTAVGAVAIALDGEISYAGTARGLFSGERSTPILESYGGVPPVLVQAIDPDPRRRRAVALGTRTRGVILSDDAGLTILEGADNVPAGEVFAIARAASDPAALWVATDRGLFKSVPGTGIRISDKQMDKLRSAWAQEPTIGETLQRALAYARIEPDRYESMATRARLAPLLPRLQVGYNYDNGQQLRTTYVLRAADALPPGADPDNDNADLFGNIGFFQLAPAVGETHTFTVLLVWELDRLILNPDELRGGARQTYRASAEHRISDHVQEAYAARRRLMTEMQLDDKKRGNTDAALKRLVQQQLRLEELTAELDAATGGAFTQPQQEQP
jgi:hypothetical protein